MSLNFVLAGILGLMFACVCAQAQVERQTDKSIQKQNSAQPVTNGAGAEVGDDEVISVSTSEVLLPVTVRDANGQLVTGLKREDFRVFEDGREQSLNDLALRRVPVDVILMIDSSSSAVANFDDFRQAAAGFADKLSTDDRLALIKFDDKVELLQDWTTSRYQFRRALARISPGVFTRFNDALMLAGKEQFNSSDRRHAIIVLTDGIDNGTGYTRFDSALRSLLLSQVTVYVVSNTKIERDAKMRRLQDLLSGSDSSTKFNQLAIQDLRLGLKVLDLSEQGLSRLTELTGGRLYRPESFRDLSSIYAEVAEELKNQYGLYYSPLNKARDGGFRRVKVEAGNGSLHTTTRAGYFAPAK